MASLSGKKVVMIIASHNFRDEEFKEPYKLLKSLGATVTVASSSLDESPGMLGYRVKPEKLVKDVKVEEVDAVVFVGGSGASEYFDDPTAQAIAKTAVAQNKLCAAICIAPSTLANAGVLTGKKATCYSSQEDHLKEAGVQFVRQPVVRDGRIVTAEGPRAAAAFAKALAEVLAGA